MPSSLEVGWQEGVAATAEVAVSNSTPNRPYANPCEFKGWNGCDGGMDYSIPRR